MAPSASSIMKAGRSGQSANSEATFGQRSRPGGRVARSAKGRNQGGREFFVLPPSFPMRLKSVDARILLVAVEREQSLGPEQFGQRFQAGQIEIQVPANLDFEMGQPVSPDTGLKIQRQRIVGPVFVVCVGRGQGITQANRVTYPTEGKGREGKQAEGSIPESSGRISPRRSPKRFSPRTV